MTATVERDSDDNIFPQPDNHAISDSQANYIAISSVMNYFLVSRIACIHVATGISHTFF